MRSPTSVLYLVAQYDKVSRVRKTAIEKLSKSSSPKNYASLFETAVGDSSYLVAAAALKALNEADAKRALELAKQFEQFGNQK